jgi:D-glucosaminate-6-phosphate ammonia-lyase
MNDIFSRLGLRRVINASGTETPYGASPVRQEVLQAVAQLAPYSVLMHELQSVASGTISRATGAEAGCVTGCTAASIAISVAAAMTGLDLGRVEQLPDARGMRSEVVLQRGHEVSYGHNVSQNVRLAGARVVEIGASHQTGAYQLRHALAENTAAALFVVSHLTAPHGMIPLEEFVSICHDADVPVIVDAASVPDPRPYINAGADLVLWSAHKAFSSFTAGFIAGRHHLVHACIYQEHGIGRPMKVGKEGVTGAIVALEEWMACDHEAEMSRLTRRIEHVCDRLNQQPGILATREGRQVRLKVDPAAAGASAPAIAAYLAAGDPAIIVWHHRALAGELLLALGKISDEESGLLCLGIETALKGEAQPYEGRWVSVGDAFEHAVARWA